jgi:hypothetical protein
MFTVQLHNNFDHVNCQNGIKDAILKQVFKTIKFLNSCHAGFLNFGKKLSSFDLNVSNVFNQI